MARCSDPSSPLQWTWGNYLNDALLRGKSSRHFRLRRRRGIKIYADFSSLSHSYCNCRLHIPNLALCIAS